MASGLTSEFVKFLHFGSNRAWCAGEQRAGDQRWSEKQTVSSASGPSMVTVFIGRLEQPLLGIRIWLVNEFTASPS
jgi:hypothetical protein